MLDDWQWLQPAATLTSAALVTVAAFLTLRQRDRADRQTLAQRDEADRKQEWWRRTQWAIDKTLYPDPDARIVGFLALQQLRASPLTDSDDLELLSRVSESELWGLDSDDEPTQDEA